MTHVPLCPATKFFQWSGVESDRRHHPTPVMATRRRAFMASPRSELDLRAAVAAG
jgi:hypothetical protein